MMSPLADEERFSSRILLSSYAVTLVVAVITLKLVSQGRSSLPHQLPPAAPPLLEAEILKAPSPPTHLSEAKKTTSRPAAPEKKINTTVSAKSAAAPLNAADLSQQNQTTEAAPNVRATHGPAVLDSTIPKLPSYLRDQNLKTSVLIEFTIQPDGAATPHLIGSSGNEELDALALKAARQWRFSPASENGNHIQSQVRLRINFQVDEN